MKYIKPTSRFRFFQGRRTILDKEAMQEIGTICRDRIMKRIGTKGTDVRDARMRPYSPTYARSKAKQGRQTGYRDFFVTGRFWHAFRVIRSTAAKVTIGWTSGRDAQIALAQSENEEFLGLSPQDEKAVSQEIEKIVARELPKLSFITRK